jgi:hypothetical protein
MAGCAGCGSASNRGGLLAEAVIATVWVAFDVDGAPIAQASSEATAWRIAGAVTVVEMSTGV